MPLNYSIAEENRSGYRVLVLRDEARDQTVRILPEVGANVFDYSVRHRGERYPILEPPPSVEVIGQRPTAHGNPVLFPFPNRIRQGRWSWQGRTYQFEDTSAGGNHIHGLVYYRPWEVAVHRSTPDGATASFSFRSTDHEDIGRQYPFPFELLLSCTLHEGALQLDFSATNVGEAPMPMGYGLHPYFSAPIGSETAPEDCRIVVPAEAYWELEDFLPTGKVLPVSGKYDLRGGRPLAGLRFDDVFTQVLLDPDGRWRCRIEDEGIGLRTVVEAESIFREIVVYTPPGRRAICFEPYTCPTDAPNLAARGLDVGLIVLEPEETFSATVRVIPEPMG
ncbi:MAG: aldose 1-epimerase [Candidatus Poribacteria bacterium]|nr:MAG: aldose 1-epimerase [Candidatus Poribacteria bacterium]